MTSRSIAATTGARTDRDAAVRRLLTERLGAHYRLATALLGDRHAAEEATHDAVVRALRSSGQLRELSSFDAWFRRILVNACRDVGKRRRSDRTQTIEEAPLPPPVDDPTRAWVEHEAVRRALRRLSRDHQEVVVMRFYADLPLDDIAAALGVRTGTVKSRLHYALKQLRAEFDAAARPAKEVAR